MQIERNTQDLGDNLKKVPVPPWMGLGIETYFTIVPKDLILENCVGKNDLPLIFRQLEYLGGGCRFEAMVNESILTLSEEQQKTITSFINSQFEQVDKTLKSELKIVINNPESYYKIINMLAFQVSP